MLNVWARVDGKAALVGTITNGKADAPDERGRHIVENLLAEAQRLEATSEKALLDRFGNGSYLRVEKAAGVQQRDLKTTLQLYRDVITGYVEDAIAAKSVRSPALRMKAEIRGMAEQAYVEGLRDGGVENPDEALTDEDRAAINEWVAEQVSHVTQFLKDAVAQGNTGGILNRVELWVGSLESLGNLGKAAAQANMMVTWQYGDTQHCETCARLNGQRHRLSWFIDKGYVPREPGSETLECGGWNCACGLYNDDGDQVL